MNADEFERLTSVNHPIAGLVSAMDMTSKTLLYGYNANRESHHTFQHEGNIHTVIFDYDKNIVFEESGKEMEAIKLIPKKRLYPEHCDFGFCALLLSKGFEPTFLPFDASRAPAEPGIHHFTNIPELDNGVNAPRL